MDYVISDIHGAMDLWHKLVGTIDFKLTKKSEEYFDDRLFVLGDIIDKGPDSVLLLFELSRYSNVFAIAGNHELDFLKVYEITQKKHATAEEIRFYDLYTANGGFKTLSDFFKLSNEKRNYILGYLRSLPLYYRVNTHNHKYILVHAGLGNFKSTKPMSHYTADELTRYRVVDDEYLFRYKKVVCGHTPTLKKDNTPAEVAYKGSYICIDCGCSFPLRGGRLACLRLDDPMNPIYIV